jgi:hypothetical protein
MKLAQHYSTLNPFERLSQPLSNLNILKTPDFISPRSRLPCELQKNHKKENQNPQHNNHPPKSFRSLLNA